MPSAPLTCSSMGVVTLCSTTWALAPGNVAVTCTVGGLICGYCEIGRPWKARAPASTMTIDSTAAKIGRSMKKTENMVSALGRRRSAAGGGLLGPGRGLLRLARRALLDGDLDPGPHFLRAFHDDALARLHAGIDHHEILRGAAHLNRAHGHLVVVADDEERLHSLGLLDRLLRDEHRVLPLFDEHPHAHEQPRPEEAVGIGELAADRDRSGCRVHLRRNQVDPAGLRIRRSIGEDELQRRWRGRRLADPLLVVEMALLADAEADVHRLDAVHGVEERGPRLHEGADLHLRRADSSREWG